MSREPSSKKYFLTIDQGTSATKAILFDRSGDLVSRFDITHSQLYPQPGWVEQDPGEIFNNVLAAIRGVLETVKSGSDEIICISISNQRETTLIWDQTTGKPVMNAIGWQCQRADKICNQLSAKGYDQMVKQKTGLVLSPYFSAAKAKWMIDQMTDSGKIAERANLRFGNMDTWLIWKLTGGNVHATDYTNASRTQLFNINSLQWDAELLTLFDLHPDMMPAVKSSDDIFGYTLCLSDEEIPIAGVLGDSHAAFFGQCCTKQGMAKATYGTGSSVMMHAGTQPVESKNVVTSIGYSLKNEVFYVLEGNINSTGATIKWLIDDLELLKSVEEAEELAISIKDNLGVYLVPAFVGLSAPYWESDVRAIITNLSRGVKKAHIARAALESIAYQILDVVKTMSLESGISLQELRVDGGPTKNNFLMEFQSDMLNVPVVRNHVEELSAMGAMYMGGLALGIWQSPSEIEALRTIGKVFKPNQTEKWRDKNYSGWQKAIKDLINNVRK